MLTPRQHRFVIEFLVDLSPKAAAIRAGYSAKTAGPAGSRLLANVNVKAEIAKRQARVSDRLEITVEKVLRNLEDHMTAAAEAGQFSAAIKAAELHGKHIGMFVERTEGKITIIDTIDRPPQETREQWLARTQKELNGALGTTAGTAD